MRRISLLLIPLLLSPDLPVAAEMFGPDYQPCGNQPNTTAIVECVEAKTKLWDARLNKAYKELP